MPVWVFLCLSAALAWTVWLWPISNRFFYITFEGWRITWPLSNAKLLIGNSLPGLLALVWARWEGKESFQDYVGELISVENRTRMVRSRDRVAYRHVSSIHVGGARAFLGESTSAICAIARNQLSCTPLRPAMGGDSVESLRIEEAPMSLFAALVCLNYWRLLGTMAYTDVGVNCDLPHSSVLGNLLCKSCCMVRYLFLLVRPKRAEPARYDPPTLDNLDCAKPCIFRSNAWHHLCQPSRNGVDCLRGYSCCRETEVDFLARFRTKLSMISTKERSPLCP
jgi:hypothetical protein